MSPRVVRVVPDVSGIDKEFDYLVPEPLGDQVRVGSIVRMPLHGRRVGGWIVDDDVAQQLDAAALSRLKPITKVSGDGPPPELVALARWAAWRWAGRWAAVLRAASPPGAVRVPMHTDERSPRPPADVSRPGEDAIVRDAFTGAVAVVRWPPSADLYPFVETALLRGPALIVCPSVSLAKLLAVRARRGGHAVALHPRDWAAGFSGATVIGARGAVWAPVARLGSIVVIDEHDTALQEERTPTWHARDVAVERARRAGVPCVLLSPLPSLEALHLPGAHVLRPARSEERSGWPPLEIVDMTREDPATGLFTPSLVRLVRSGARVACVVNRTGRAKLLVCATCRELARCERCGAAVGQDREGVLSCARCGTVRPLVCLHCHGSRFSARRLGVARLREELEALAGQTVVEVTAQDGDEPPAPADLYVGTEAVLHRVERLDAVAFVDLDPELLAPRLRAGQHVLGLLARSARVVGGRRSGARLLVQTRYPKHPVIDAALHADPSRLQAAEEGLRRSLGAPPFRAWAELSGAGAAEYAQRLLGATAMLDEIDGTTVDVVGPDHSGSFLVRARDHDVLCDVLARTPRPTGRLRVAVDP